MHSGSNKTACLLTIGTEVTDGQIVNTNGSWLAASPNDLGFNVSHIYLFKMMITRLSTH